MRFFMQKNKTFHRKKIVTFFFVCVVLLCLLMVRLGYLMVKKHSSYMKGSE